LDTFLLRTITVPAIAVLVGQANWWRPSGRLPASWWPLKRKRGARSGKRKPLLPEEEKSPAWLLDDVVGFSLRDGLRL
jgi:putative drug exporter of the RND superfamily